MGPDCCRGLISPRNMGRLSFLEVYQDGRVCGKSSGLGWAQILLKMPDNQGVRQWILGDTSEFRALGFWSIMKTLWRAGDHA